MSSRIMGSVQPSYLAWIPFSKRMQMSDVFVYLDDVEFSKNTFHNRNRIKTANGELTLTVPVSYGGNSRTFIKDMPINNKMKWSEKHWRSISLAYSKAKYFRDLQEPLESIYLKEWEFLGDLNIALIELLRKYLGIKTKCVRSSELNAEGENNEKLVNLCKILGVDKFIVKPGTNDYHPQEYFEERGIGFEYFTYKPEPYPQLYGDFIPGLSILDYAMNCGPESF
jgi:hypothetical protein